MVMNRITCIDILATVWVISLLFALLHTISAFASPFYSNFIHQFFYKIPQLVKLGCSGLYLMEIAVVAIQAALDFSGYLFILVSYVGKKPFQLVFPISLFAPF